MKMKQVSDNCYAALNERNRVCDANSGLINLGGGVVIDTQSDLAHAREMIELFGKVWPAMPKGEGMTSLDATKRIEFGPYGEWRAPARLYMNVERAYREFRDEPPDAPWDAAKTFDAIYEVAQAKGIEPEY